MTIQDQLKEAINEKWKLVAMWKEAGWTDGEIESSLISYFEDSPTFVDDEADSIFACMCDE